MQLLTVLAWIALIYCAAGMLTALVVARMARHQTSATDTDASRQLLKVFAAWPVVVRQMVIGVTGLSRAQPQGATPQSQKSDLKAISPSYKGATL